jgi:outer membrane protein OmpA-like peptidoglycan-associated protein
VGRARSNARWGLALTIALLGCASAPAMQGRISALRESLDQADRNGARRCAPRELALGRAHAEFADRELAEGHMSRAEDHLLVSDANARAAITLSPPDRCAPRAVVVATGPGDRDGDGILDPDDRCPDQPENFNGVEDTDGCPEDPDSDGDGLADSRDLCPLDPEDRDTYLDDDGCPELDNDADGIADNVDNCRNEPEDPDTFQDTDGCPDNDNDQDTVADLVDQCPNEAGPVDRQGCPPVFQHLEVTRHGVRFQVEFDFDRATLRPNAAATLDEVVQFLQQSQNRALRYEVGGHTSSEGSVRHNDDLSRRRALTVRSYLASHGIEAERLTSRGYGARQPLESNRTNEGRQRNRRVELNEIDAQGRLVQ